jgi:hypothetical protein
MDNEETFDLQPIVLGTNIRVIMNKLHLKQTKVGRTYSVFTCFCVDVQRSRGCVVTYGETINLCDHFLIIKTTFYWQNAYKCFSY